MSMSNFNKIPSPGHVPTAPSDITKQELQEIAGLTPSKRNIILYERQIEHLKEVLSHLQALVDNVHAENTKLSQAVLNSNDNRVSLETIRRSKLEMFVAFAIATFLMAVGGGLLGTFPATAESLPWQHAVGWSLIITGAIFGVLSRTIIQFVLHRFPKVAEDWMQ
jgi:hypothetical protein